MTKWHQYEKNVSRALPAVFQSYFALPAAPLRLWKVITFIAWVEFIHSVIQQKALFAKHQNVRGQVEQNLYWPRRATTNDDRIYNPTSMPAFS